MPQKYWHENSLLFLLKKALWVYHIGLIPVSTCFALYLPINFHVILTVICIRA